MLENFISSVQKRLFRVQNSDPHSAASTRIVESSDPSRSPTSGSVDGSNRESTGLESKNSETSNNQRKRKKVDGKQINNTSGLSPEEQEMLKSSKKCRKTIKKLPVVNY